MSQRPFQLHQLLTEPEPLSPGVKVNARKLTTYNKTYNFSLDGKIGGKLKMLLDVEVSGIIMLNTSGTVFIIFWKKTLNI